MVFDSLTDLLKIVNPEADVQIDQNGIKVEDTPKPKKRRADSNKTVLFVPELEGGRYLKKVECWFGPPSSGKSTRAENLAKGLKEQGLIEDYAKINCHEDMSVINTLKTTKTTESGNWVFSLNRIFNMLTDSLQKPYLIILDEANLMNMTVAKGFQPLLDDTEGEFDFEDKTYQKNPNVFFILTINHDDLGINPLPQAILSRAYLVEFEEQEISTLSKWSGIPERIIKIMGNVREMFAHLGNLPDFHKDVRQLKYLYGLNGQQFKHYITSILSFHNIQWKEAVAISPEFQNLIDEFDKIKW